MAKNENKVQDEVIESSQEQNLIVEINDVEISFDGAKILNIPYLSFEREKCYFIKGESGTGKTTLFNIISGLVLPDLGSVVVDGELVNLMSESERDKYRANCVGYIFQDFNLFNGFTAVENVMVAMTFSVQKTSTKAAKKKALAVLDKVGLLDKANVKINKMSGGEKQRVAIARAVVNMPKLLLADEPTGNLDRKNSGYIMDLLINTAKENKCTLLVISHDLSFADKFDEALDIYDFNEAKED